jgi:ribonuclease D
MFSPANDIYMTQNTLGCTISPIRDISIGQKLLNLPVNLSDYLNIDKAEKDLFQRANWLRRPITPQLLDYAIKDVLLLLKIDADLSTKLKELDLYTAYINGSDLLSKRNFVVNQLNQYKEKFPGYKRLKPEQKRLAAKVWIFREQLGRHFDCPVGYLLSKQAMAKIIGNPDSILEQLIKEINRQRKTGKKISGELIKKIYLRQTGVSKNI